MLHALAALLPLVSFTPSAAPCTGPASPAQEGRPAEAVEARGLEHLLPQEALAVLRIDSLEGAVGLARRLGELFGDAPALDADTFLKTMLQAPFGADDIDGSRPFFAVFEMASLPLPSFVVPARDAAALASSMTASGSHATAAGDWVRISLSAPASSGGEPSTLAAKMLPGAAALHVNLATVVEIFGPMIEMSLQQAETMLAAASEDAAKAGGPMVGSIMELYMEWVHDFIASSATLDLAIRHEGGRVALVGALGVKDGSALDVGESSGEHDLQALAGRLDPSAPASVVMVADWQRMMEWYAPFMEAAMEIYPEPLREQFTRYMELYAETYGLLSGGTAMSFGFGAEGMSASAYFDCTDADAYLAGVEGIMSSFQAEGSELPGVTASPLRRSELNGRPVLEWTVHIDASLLDAAGPAADELDEDQRAQLQTLIDTIYGADGIQVALSGGEGRVGMAMGPDADWRRRILREMNAEAGAPPADLVPILAELAGSEPAYVQRMDLGLVLAQVGALMQVLEPEATSFPEVSAPMTFWGGFRGHSWSFGMDFDLAGLGRFVEAAAAGKGSGHEEHEDPGGHEDDGGHED